MRRVGTFIVLFVLLLSLCGCTPIFSPTDSLLIPPQLPKNQTALQAAFERAFGEGLPYKSPVSGKYHSAFIIEDIDGDADEEALIFYQPDLMSDDIRFAVMDKVNGDWVHTSSMDGFGAEVYSVDILDMDADGKMEVVICWRSSDSETSSVSVYIPGGESFTLSRLFSTAYAKMQLADLDRDGKQEMILLSLYPVSGGRLAVASILGKQNNSITTLARRTLDSEIRAFDDMIICPDEGGSTIFIDADKSAGKLTEIVLWDAETKTILEPLSDPDKDLCEITGRVEPIPVRDLDGDGVPEIPSQTELAYSEVWRNGVRLKTTMYKTSWFSYQDGDFVSVRETILHPDSGWMFTIPEGWDGQFTTYSDLSENKWNFYITDENTDEQEYLFSVIFTTQTRWNSSDSSRYRSYSLLTSEGQSCIYINGLNEQSRLQVRKSDLQNAFSYIGG